MASFGYSVGDFIAVIQLAYTIYDRCASSVGEYKDIGRDVGNTRIVLSAIRRYWEAEESRGRTLIVAHQEELKQLAENSDGILKKINEVLDKHRGLEDRANIKDKLKWALTSFVRDIGPQRQALQENTNALAIFNATLTADNASGVADQQLRLLEAQGQLLKFLVTRYFEFQTGTNNRVEPAFSQITVKDVQENEDGAWREIDAEFEAASFNPAVVKRNRGFIKEWITTVIPEEREKEAGLSTDITTVEEETPTNAGGTTGPLVEQTSANSQGQPEASQGPDAVVINPSSSPVIATMPVPVRPISVNSHRSKSSDWQDPNITSRNFVAKMLAKVLRSKYGEDCDDLYALPIKRAFHHLDWTNRGWISFGDVQKHCLQAGMRVEFSLSEQGISDHARKFDANNDNQVSRDEFIEIIMSLRQRIMEDIIISKATIGGRAEAGMLLKNFFDSCAMTDEMLPPLWHHSTRYSMHKITRRYQHDLIGHPEVIAPLEQNFTNAAFVATTHCSSHIAAALTNWRIALMALPKEEAAEYTTALDNVIRATERFYVFDGSHFAGKLYPLDHNLSQTNLLPLEYFEQFAGCPAEELRKIAKFCWELLDSILAFVYDLKPKSFKQISLTSHSTLKASFTIGSDPPKLAEWRRLRMLERSRRILNNLQQWDAFQKPLQECQQWFQSHESELNNQMTLAIECTTRLYVLGQKLKDSFTIHEVRINSVDLVGLKRGLFREPSTIITLSVDGKDTELEENDELQEKTIKPSWYLTRTISVTKSSQVRLVFHDKKYYDKNSTAKQPRSLIGYFEFKITDVTNFDGYSQVNKSGPLIVSDPSSPRNSKLQVTVNVGTNWTPIDSEVVLSEEDNLAEKITHLPLPAGWEARRTKSNDVYFLDVEENKATACLWRDPIPVELRTQPMGPLPLLWTEVIVDGKIKYKDPQGLMKESRPAPERGSTFQHVIQARKICSPLLFLPHSLVTSFETEGVELALEKRAKRILRLPAATS